MVAFRRALDDTMRSLGFLSRIPLSDRWFEGFDGRYEHTARMMPLAGALAALPTVLTLLSLNAIGADPLLASMLAVACGLVVTGALHEDGLADTFDGLGLSGPSRRIEAMRDSALGVFGACALVVALGVRVAAFAVLSQSLIGAAAVVLASAAIGRAGMVYVWGTSSAASMSGAATVVGKPALSAVRFAVVLVTLLAVPSVVLYGPFAAIVGTLLVLATVRIVRWRMIEPIGGHTGDILGATAIMCELAWLVPLAVIA